MGSVKKRRPDAKSFLHCVVFFLFWVTQLYTFKATRPVTSFNASLALPKSEVVVSIVADLLIAVIKRKIIISIACK